MRFLYFQYRPGMWAWEIFQCFHKVVLAGLLMFVLDGTALQIVIGIFVTFVIFGMFSYFQPFLDPKETILEVLALFAIFICLLLGLMFKTGIAGDGVDSELPSKYTTPLLFVGILLPVATAVIMVYHDLSGAIDDARAAKALRKQRLSGGITHIQPENLEIVNEKKPVPEETHAVEFVSTLPNLTLVEFDEALRREYVRGAASALGIEIKAVTIVSARAGSLIVDVRVTVADLPAATAMADRLADPTFAIVDSETFGPCEVSGVQVKSERKKKKKRKTKRGSEMKRDSDAGRLAAAPPLPAAPSPHEPDGLCERLGFSWCSSAPPAPTPSEPVDFKQADHTEPQGDAAVSISMEV